jgi:hypothetical protein
LVPRAFAIHWNEIRYPKTPYISIEAKLFQTPDMGQSGFGIHLILPVDFPYPKDWLGHPLYPLAQLDSASNSEMNDGVIFYKFKINITKDGVIAHKVLPS